MPDTKMNETKLPREWKWVKLATVAEITSSKRIFQHEYVSNGIPFYRTKEIKELSEGKDLTFDLFISNEKYNEIKNRFAIPKKGDILLSAVGTIGISYIIKNDEPFYFKDGNLMWLRNLNGIDSKFLSYGLTNFIKNRKGAKTSGSAYSALTIETIKNFKFPLPPLQTQEAIVSKIEELFSELDKGIEDLKTAQQQLKTYRQSVLKWAFEGKSKLAIGVLFDFVGGGTPSKQVPNYWIGDIPWASVKDVKGDYLNDTIDRISEEGLKNSSANIANKDEVILITRISPGKAIITNIRAAINQDLKVVKPKFETTSKFIFYVFQAIERECVKKSNGTTVLGINLTSLKEIQVPILKIEEQNLIVQEIESRLSVADKMEESIVQSLQQAEALRQSILKKAFSGELV